MAYDRLAERYLDKVIPQSRMGVTTQELERRGIDPAMYDEASDTMAALTRNGVRPTMDQVVVAMARKRQAEARRGI